MVEIRKIKKSRYLVAFLLAASVLTIGILIGLLINTERTSFLEKENKLQRLDYDSIQLQYLYLTNTLEKDRDCTSATKSLEKQISDLGILGNKLENFIQSSTAKAEDYNLLKREYTLAELRYWLFINNIRQICNDDTVALLYFYSNNNCNECRTQGVVLSKVKADLKDKLLVFALDYDFNEEPLLNIIKNKYNVNELPTLIINDEKNEGLKSYEDLLKIICPRYKQNLDVCNKDL